MDTAADVKSVDREIAIDAKPETVWELLVNPSEMIRWMGQSATVDLRRGGAYRVQVIPGNAASGEFVEIDAPHRLVYTWGWEGNANVPPGSTTLVFELVPAGKGTLLRFSHRDLPSAEAATSHAHGWSHYFERLVATAAGGEPGPDPWITGPMAKS
ncbi:MAG: SRPBCC family protein [Acidobacteriota bacterium]